MKYNLVISRTYVTEVKVLADSLQEAWEWVNTNSDFIHEEELNQCNVVSEETELQEDAPSPNEADELLDLACHIDRFLHDYRHVSDYVPSEMFEALKIMKAHAQ